MPFLLTRLDWCLLPPSPQDYTLNVLAGGPLQAAEGTALVVDETTLETGLLTQVGIDNLSALKEVIQGQRVNYDFQYYLMNMARWASFWHSGVRARVCG